jgi:phosphatidylinositol-3-phosphatase
MQPQRLATICAGLLTGTLLGCKGEQAVVTSKTSGQLPSFGHVFVVVEENHDYTDVIGNPAMPYLNSLAQQYGLATQYYANTHPSIGNYFMLTTGQIVTNNDGYTDTVTADNIVRELLKAGKTWKAYAEDLPLVGYTGASQGRYARRHNPLSFFSDVVGDSTQRRNLVPFTQLATDLADSALPDYAFLVPNLCNDAHDCSLSTADTWLQTNMDPLIQSPLFQRDGLLIITFDESGGDNTGGGGRVAWVVVSPKAKRAFQSTTTYEHESTLRLTAQALGLTAFPGAADSASNMAEFFQP